MVIEGIDEELADLCPILSLPLNSPSIKYSKLVIPYLINGLKLLVTYAYYASNSLSICALMPKIVEGFDKELSHQ
jgi:hypothetical protein